MPLLNRSELTLAPKLPQKKPPHPYCVVAETLSPVFAAVCNIIGKAQGFISVISKIIKNRTLQVQLTNTPRLVYITAATLAEKRRSYGDNNNNNKDSAPGGS